MFGQLFGYGKQVGAARIAGMREYDVLQGIGVIARPLVFDLSVHVHIGRGCLCKEIQVAASVVACIRKHTVLDACGAVSGFLELDLCRPVGISAHKAQLLPLSTTCAWVR